MWRSSLLSALAAVLLLTGSPVLAESVTGAGSLQKKADIIYNLCKFIRWPATSEGRIDSSDDFTICIVNGSELYRELRNLAGATVGGDSLQVAEIGFDLIGIEQCRVLFLARGALPEPIDHWLAPLIVRAARYPLLTISDATGFTSHGGMIELMESGERVRFTISVRAARQAGLQIVAPLLSIATTVKP